MLFHLFFWEVCLQGPVFQKPISTNPELNFNLGFYTSLFNSLFGIISSTLYGASNHQIVDKKNYTEFSSRASRTEIRFHTNPGFTKPSFEQPSPGVTFVWLNQSFNPLTPKISWVILLTVCHKVLVKNLVLDQLIIPWLIFFFILITCLLDIVLIL